ncbi:MULTISPECIES: 50S ribosomal protein L21 [Capnocytophaga]|uniref:Large ribosomal subunit protein bL21 n=1 Tax=Capnocytophaga canis TaxID=1848903 RepID=A0A0B7I2X3_9FLAO|nr:MULTISPECIES: 50S ribosomal protein L21 [Capnocytophaga]ATA72500.1 50S ribosomal protein L21 [Capnocytophaga sp. H4358]ATA74612.1 50S ribosomal protein L21 [Capnocytophaga sp. H2931]CEN43462.1 50S ribosomal protein L21 [Capnocytophaga canis]CEN44472.1 50S ribosomal protein L21 [Capnocytophaga canis]GIM60434.1 50S ribosomal protein L21 [Capnocytophaga canis]
MYAIVEIAGQQFKVSKDQKVFVHRLQNEEGQKVTFNNVLLLDNAGAITVGAPAISGASVEAKVLKHLKGDKVVVFKKKRRKGFKVKNGHRQYLTEIVIENIVASGTVKAEKTEKKEAKSAKADDLKKIEGIGPKASEALVAAGVDTFAKLAKKSVDEIKAILTEASSTLSHLDPQTWAAQAQLAADGKWDELKKWQDELNGGVQK